MAVVVDTFFPWDSGADKHCGVSFKADGDKFYFVSTPELDEAGTFQFIAKDKQAVSELIARLMQVRLSLQHYLDKEDKA